jgi:hypothetical protein
MVLGGEAVRVGNVIRTILDWLVGGGIAAVGKELRQARLDRYNAETDDKRIEADRRIKELEAESLERRQKLADPFLRMPLFLLELSAVVYTAAIFFDSSFPTDWLTPLELPGWFKDHYSTILIGIVGISVAERGMKHLKR